jgi:hypothetical protein
MRRVLGASTAGRIWLRDHGTSSPLNPSVKRKSAKPHHITYATCGITLLHPKRSNAEKVSEITPPNSIRRGLPDCVDKEHKGRACVSLSCRKNRKTCPSKTHHLRTRSRIVIRLRLLSRRLPRLGETFRSRTQRRQHRQCNGRAVCYCSHIVLTGMPTLMPSHRSPYIYDSESAHSSTFPHQLARPPQTRLPTLSRLWLCSLHPPT